MTKGSNPAVDRGQALDCRQHRHGRRDHQIAVEQGGREHAEHDDSARPPFLARQRPVDEGEECEAAALALVVGAHDDRDIFQGHDDHHRPEDETQDAVDMQLVGDQRVVARKGLAEGVNRRGADVAVNDADGAHDQLVKRPLGVPMRSVLRGFGCSAPGRGDVHVLKFRPDRLRIRIPSAARQRLGCGRRSVALPFRPRNRTGQGRKARL